MLDTIQNFVAAVLPPGHKLSQGGWHSFNAPCCHHRGERQDRRGRGGIILSAGSVSYHCFNCHYTASYQPGRSLSYKFRTLLHWMNVDDSEIQRMAIEALRIKELFNPEDLDNLPQTIEEEIAFEPRQLPADAKRITELATFYGMVGDQYDKMPPELDRVMDYLLNRQIDIVKYDFYWTPTEKNGLKNRLIIPYIYQGEIIGYTARTILPDVKPKYYSDHPADFVFNLDTQQRDWKFVIVCEGAFDAMSVDGVSVSGAEISKQQAELIARLNREVIVVPDWDKAGKNLVEVAMNYGWTVSFPTWRETCKDINEATIKYGKLFVIKDILENRESNSLKIKLRQRVNN